MTNNELTIINSHEAQTPFRVLDINNEPDLLFLRAKSIDIPLSILKTNDFQHFLSRLKTTMVEERGVGIAAPQVGVGRNLFLFIRLDKENFPIQVAINPRIVNCPETTFCFENDGCLSVPERSGTTKRYAWVEVEYYDEEGTLKTEKLLGGGRGDDFTGVIFQHEFDHLQGILYIDRLCEEVGDDVEK